jgi:REP element-mobilizing transposase RayT
MPNHAHAVLWPFEGESVSEILHSWKSYTSKEAKRILRRDASKIWQAESFNHWIRDDDERARLVTYVERNPVKARLCNSPEKWKWSSVYRAATVKR